MNDPSLVKSSCETHHICTIQLFGDLSLDGLYCDPQHHSMVKNNIKRITNMLGPCDLRVINWESPIWGDGNVNVLKKPRLSTTQNAAECILPLNIDVALLANNHTYDCLRAGYDATIRFLDSHNIAYLGAGKSPERSRIPLVLERNGIKLGLLNYVGDETNPNLPNDATVYLNRIDKENIKTDISQLRGRCDHILVFLHWGRDERVRIPDVSQRILARSICEAGATTVVGSHAHCLQGHESWGNSHIFYCIGNFLFSPVLCEPGKIISPWDEDGRKVGVAKVTFDNHGIRGIEWTYFYQESNSLLLVEDISSKRSRSTRKRSALLKISDAKLKRMYSFEVFKSHIRYQVSCYGWSGLVRKIFSISIMRRAWKIVSRRPICSLRGDKQ